MLSFDQAKAIAESTIAASSIRLAIELVIVDDAIIEKPYAWIFPYMPKRWLEGDISYAIGGNCPLFEDKRDGRISAFPTGLSMEGSLVIGKVIRKQ